MTHDSLCWISSREKVPSTVQDVSQPVLLTSQVTTHSKNVFPWYVSCSSHRNSDPFGLRSKGFVDCRCSNRLGSSVFKLGFRHSESRLLDQGSRSEGNADVGDPLTADCRTAATPKKQTENSIASLAVGRVRSR